MSAFDIAVVGSNMVDLISYVTRMPENGETIEAPDFAMGCGGKGANQAIAAARMGARVLMVTRVGNDLFGGNTRANFEANGIDTRYVLDTDASSGVAPIFVDQEGRNRILIIKGANAHLTPADVEAAADDIAGCGLIVMQLEIPLETVYATIDLGNRLGVPVLLNPAPADPALDLDQVAKCEWFVPNESELALLTGMPVDTIDDIRAAAGTLIARGLRNVVVTLGARGALWLTADGETLVPGHEVAAIDTTGAGDAFIGAFARELTRSGDPRAALEAGNRYAADSVTKRGTQTSYATAAELDATA